MREILGGAFLCTQTLRFIQIVTPSGRVLKFITINLNKKETNSRDISESQAATQMAN